MKEYEKLAREFCRRLERGDKAAEDTAVFYYREGFLKAREMASNIMLIGTALNRDDKLEAICSLGEKEV